MLCSDEQVIGSPELNHPNGEVTRISVHWYIKRVLRGSNVTAGGQSRAR